MIDNTPVPNEDVVHPLDRQVGGDHYKKHKIQPLQFAMVNGWDSAAFSILKHVTRHRDKAGEQDVRKAIHYVELRVALISMYSPAAPKMSLAIVMDDFITANGIGGQDAEVLRQLASWIYSVRPDSSWGRAGDPGPLLRALRRLLDDTYGPFGPEATR